MLIEYAAKGAAKRSESKEAKDKAREMKKKIVTLKKRTEKDISRLERQQNTLTNRIRENRKKIDKILDKLETATISELENACRRGKDQMNDDSKMFGEMISSLDAIVEMLSPPKGMKGGSEVDTAAFVGSKRAQEKIKEGERILNFVRHTSITDPLKYVPDERIYDWLRSLQLLGTFSYQHEIYVGRHLERYDVSVADEYKKCDMFGSTLLTDGRLMLTDWDNKKVKLLDKSFALIDQIVLLGNPDDVCSINPNEAAVTLTMQKTVQLINLVPKMNLSRVMYMDEHCRGITYHDGNIYVVCGGFKDESCGKIVVYTVMGEHVKTIEKNNVGQNIFTCPIAVQVISNGKLIYVTDGKRGIVTLTSNNDVVSVISYKEMAWPCGMCLDRNDNALICNGKGNNVVQVYGLNTIAIILSHKDGITQPHSICFDPDDMRIIMTSHKSKFISVFQLTKACVKDIAEGTEVHLKTVEKQSKPIVSNINKDAELTENINKSEDANRAEDKDTDIVKTSILPDIEESRLEKTTNVVTRRNSALSKGPNRDISAKESARTTSGKVKTNIIKSSLVGSRDKSTSRESLADQTRKSSSRATNQKRPDSASTKGRLLSARSDKRETRILNNTPRKSISRKNSNA